MKQIKCNSIDKLPEDWEFWRKNIDREKYSNINEDIFPDVVTFCESPFFSSEKNYEIEIIRRIGSQSADGEVYCIKIQNIEFAMKLMPRIDSSSKDRNINEINIAKEASKYSDYFPKTFAFGSCDKSSFYKNLETGFVNKAIEFHNYNLLVEQINKNNLRKRFDANYRNGMGLIDLSQKYLLNYENLREIEVDFLISELANGDLGNYVKNDRSIDEWKTILSDILTGIYYLTVMLGKVHPDLHLGNVLIIKNPLKALIHDFGRCYSVDNNIPETYKASLLSFCKEFLSCSTRDDLRIPRLVLIILTYIFNIVQRTTINSSNIKEVYEEILFPIIDNM